MSNIGKWMFNIGRDEIWTGDNYSTREEAIELGKAELEYLNKMKIEAGRETSNSFEIGQIEKVYPCGVDVDFILENVAENTTQGMEAGEDYLNNVTKEHSDELEQKLNDVLFAWMKEHGYEPDFFIMENIEEITI